MIVYRLCRAPFAELDGEGARLYGGRWNSPGRAMIYTASSASLAVLEVLVHLDLPPELIPSDYVLLTIDAPDGAPVSVLGERPADAEACRAAGDAFLQGGEALALSVPSAVVPQERNLLFNPAHAAARELRIVGREPFRFDPRLLG